MVGAWEGACGPLGQYGMQYSRLFANLCNARVPAASLAASAQTVCSPPAITTTAS